MSTFTPPTTAGMPTADPAKNDIHNRHWSFFGSWAMGLTVWKDVNGDWHQAIFPYQGGGTFTTHNGSTTTTTVESSVNHLADAQVVYLGGHVYDLTAEEEADLIAGGYGEYIT